ncbi:MAG TPA: hypothetical protein VGM20_07205 [Gemmatimonadales bacterium]|jgi:peroxiredoxin
MPKWFKDVLLVVAVAGAAYGVARLVVKHSAQNGAVGTSISSISVQRMGEDSVSKIQFGNSPVLLYIFEESCQYCEQQVSGWEQLANRAAPYARVLAISTRPLIPTSDAKLLHTDGVEYVGAASFTSLQKQFGIAGVPVTIVISRSHRIQEVRSGLQPELSLAEILDIAKRANSSQK